MNTSAEQRYLIVNADDFGRSPGVNRGVVRGHESGIVTSASLMVRWPAAIEAALYGFEHPDLSLGLHVDFEELVWEQGAWVQRYQVAAAGDSKAIQREALLQLEAFRRLTGKDPSHIDSHQHIHQNEGIRAVLAEIADWLGIPLRGCSWRVRHCGDFYGQDAKGRPVPYSITTDGICGILSRLGPGFTELSCHPAEFVDWDSMYGIERVQETDTLCHPSVRSTLAQLGIELRSFHQLEPSARRSVSPGYPRSDESRRTA